MRAPEHAVGGMSTSPLRATRAVDGYLNAPPTVASSLSSSYRGPGGPGTRVRLTAAKAGGPTFHCACCDERIDYGWRHGKPTKPFVLVNVYDHHGRWAQLEAWNAAHYIDVGEPHGPTGDYRPPVNILGDNNNSPLFVRDRPRRKGLLHKDDGP